MQPKTTYYNTTFLFFFWVLMWNIPLKAQQRCATTESQNTDLQAKTQNHLSNLHDIAHQRHLTKQSDACEDMLLIPVVVHVLYDPDVPSSNVSEAQILSQICQLNVDFGGNNATLLEGLDNDAIYDLPMPIAAATSRGTCIRFGLATHNHLQDESLNPTGLQDGDYAIIRRSLEGLPTEFWADIEGLEGEMNDAWEISPIWNREEYLNFWVVPTIVGENIEALGIAQYPYGPAATDGVMIRARNFGSVSEDCINCGGDCFIPTPYDEGKTATHEVGHWLGLLHTWGEIQNECEEEDGIEDTPIQARPFTFGGCSDGFPPEKDSCTPLSEGGVMYMNYMDYSVDDCLILFSKGQAAVMETTLTEQGFRSRFGTTDLEERKCPYSLEVSSGASSVFGTADKPLRVCGNEDFFEMTSTGVYHYDVTRQAIAWGIWVVEDPFQQTGINPLLLPGNLPNDDNTQDDVNFQADFIEIQNTYGEGTVQLPVWGDGATYFLAPMVVNLDGSPVEQCGAVSLEGSFVKQYVAMSADVRFDACADTELFATIYFNGGLPYEDDSEHYTVSLVHSMEPNAELIPDTQRHPKWVDAVYIEVAVGETYILTIMDENGCQVVEQLYVTPDCWVDEWQQVGDIGGPPIQLLLDDGNRALEAVDDFQVGSAGMTIDAIEVKGSFNRVGKRSIPQAEMVQIKIWEDANGIPEIFALWEGEIAPTNPSNPNFHLSLEESLQLPAGKYWLGVTPKMYFEPYKHQWFWNATSIQTGERALFRDVTNLLGVEEPYNEWSQWNNIGHPWALDLSFTLLSEAKVGKVLSLEEASLCCEESTSFQMTDGNTNCTSYRMAWALAESEDMVDVQTAIAEGKAWFVEAGEEYAVVNDCWEEWNQERYSIVPFLASRYADVPLLLEGCFIGGEGVSIQLLNPIVVEVFQEWNALSNQVDVVVTITGGLSQIDGSSYEVVLDNGAVVNAVHGESFSLADFDNQTSVTLEVTDGNSCTTTFVFTDIETKASLRTSLMLHSNPVKQVLELEFEALSTTEANLRLYDLQGRLLIQQFTQARVGNNEAKIDVSFLSSGMYLLVVEYGDKQEYRKVVKR